MKGNAPLYSAQVLEDFKKAHDNRDTKPDAKEALMQEKMRALRHYLKKWNS